jgi:hypothetical protein
MQLTMGLAVVEGAVIRCTMGMFESTLMGVTGRFQVDGMYTATIADHLGPINLGTFFFCKTTQQPCMPNTPAPWTGACSSINTGGTPLLSSGATLNCVNCGTISIVDAGQSTMSTEELDPQRDSDSGFLGGVHDVLGFVADLPVPTGPIGATAGIIDAHIYNLQGDKDQARAKWWGAAGNLVPLKKLRVVKGGITKVLPGGKVAKRPAPDFGDAVHTPAQRQAAVSTLGRLDHARDYIKRKGRADRAADFEEALGQSAIGKGAENAFGSSDDDD